MGAYGVPHTNHFDLLHKLTEFVEAIGDKLDIQFRHGTDSMGNKYKTNEEAHKALFDVLEDTIQKFQAREAYLLAKGKADGRDELAREFRILLGVQE